jgi:endonuclease/exonuclease/phosphatase family metal-dependent hydrolase
MGQAARIRIATYNIHKCRGMDRRVRPERIADVIRELDADVIALQEVVNAHERPAFDQVRRLAEALDGYTWRFGENRPLYGGEYGNMTLSRFPIRFSRNYDLTHGKYERRGCLRTDVVVGDQLVHVVNVHLGTGFLGRRHQAHRLLSPELLSSTELKEPKVVLGDFNEWTRGLTTRLMQKGFQNIEPKEFLRYGRTYPGLFPLLHLDHFYFDPTLRVCSFKVHRSRKALIASDHLPMFADFTFA